LRRLYETLFILACFVILGIKIIEMDRRLVTIETQAATNLFVTTEAVKSITDIKLLRDRIDTDSKRIIALHEQLEAMSGRAKRR
jgi:hypothetical protein